MKINKNDFTKAGAELDLPSEQIEALWSRLEQNQQKTSPFSKYLYYLGALIAISSMTWFYTIAFVTLGALVSFLITLAYAIFFTVLGKNLWHKAGLKIPAGLLLTCAVCMTPLAIYNLETYLNIWNDDLHTPYNEFYLFIRGKWILMEIGTIIAGLTMLHFFRFPFLTVPIFFAAWFLTMDIVPFLFGNNLSNDQVAWLSLGFGLLLMGIAFCIDYKKHRAYAFWAYLCGTFSFWVALSDLAWTRGEGVLILYLLINILLMCLAIILKRNVLMVFGAFGLFTYLCHLAYTVFQDSILFPFALSAVGLFVIYLGYLYQKNIALIERVFFDKLPQNLQNFLAQLHNSKD